MTGVFRRAILAFPFLLAACGSEEDDASQAPMAFPPLHFDYLPPLQLNVATIEIQQRFMPSGVAPDVSAQAPVSPAAALRAMAKDRLQALGGSGRAVFAILDASLIRKQDTIRGSMAVSLTIFDSTAVQRGYATATVERTSTGKTANLKSGLYELTKLMMDAMNVEFEFQVRRNLKEWLTSAAAPGTPVLQDTLSQPRR